MSDTANLDELLLQWDELHQQGKHVVVEELCRDCPELVEDLRRRIQAIKATEWLEDFLDGNDGDPKRLPEDFGLSAHLGRYRLDELIGEGGYGQVWRGFDPELQRPVAIKVPHRDRIGETDQFLAEARRVAQLKHAGIVPVHDVGHEGDVVYVVTDLVNGESLADVFGRRRIECAEVARIVAEVATALHHAHEQGIIHRDVKPANILLDAEGRPHLTDFGIAVAKDDSSSSSVGTLVYMAPEQLAQQQHDVRSDIYSLGVVLFELLNGRRLFAGKNPADVRDGILHGVKPEFDASIPGSIQEICLRCLEVDPARRYSSAKALSEELRQSMESKQASMWAWAVVPILLLVITLGVLAWTNSIGPTISAAEAQAQTTVARMVLERHGSLRLEASDIVVDELSDLPSQPFRIVEVSFRGRQIDADDLQHLATIPSLRSLNLSLTNTINDDLHIVGTMTELRELRLNQTAVTDQGLSEILPLTNLELLELRDSAITDKGLAAVRQMPSLRKLVLVGTKITDEGVQQLMALKNLQELRVGRTAVSDEGIRRLHAALPEIEVVR
jgi:serine/threonine protein kinase